MHMKRESLQRIYELENFSVFTSHSGGEGKKQNKNPNGKANKQTFHFTILKLK